MQFVDKLDFYISLHPHNNLNKFEPLPQKTKQNQKNKQTTNSNEAEAEKKWKNKPL